MDFSGGFLADPSTINNTPNNYADSNQSAETLELYWNPNGRGIFDFTGCVVTKVVYGPGDEATTAEQDPIIGQAVAAVYSKAQAKLVDLDPDQQNVSEVWGLTLQVAGLGANPKSIANFIRGDYSEGSYNAIWAQAHKGPRSSASGSGVYQSQLKNLAWDIDAAPRSEFVSALYASSPDQLSVNFVVNSHNNAPQEYGFNKASFDKLAEEPYNIPAEILKKLEPMQKYIQNAGRSTPGDVPTKSYVSYEVNRLLGQADAEEYLDSILDGTILKYDPGNIDTTFPSGYVTGTLGPQLQPAPVYYTPSRTMAPNGSSICNFAPFNISSDNSKTVMLSTLLIIVFDAADNSLATSFSLVCSVIFFRETLI